MKKGAATTFVSIAINQNARRHEAGEAACVPGREERPESASGLNFTPGAVLNLLTTGPQVDYKVAFAECRIRKIGSVACGPAKS